MKKLIIISILLLFSDIANAGWVLNNSIGNDPDKEKLCISRLDRKGPIVPFEIDSDFVARIRSMYPDATFVVVGGQMYTCRLREGTGRFEWDVAQPEGFHWRSIKPKQFEPSWRTSEGQSIAFKICLDAYFSKSNRSNFDHSVQLSILEGRFVEVGIPKHKSKTKRGDALIAGKKVEQYDVVVQGKAFYKPANPDLTAVHFACLLSPMFEVKAIQFK